MSKFNPTLLVQKGRYELYSEESKDIVLLGAGSLCLKFLENEPALKEKVKFIFDSDLNKKDTKINSLKISHISDLESIENKENGPGARVDSASKGLESKEPNLIAINNFFKDKETPTFIKMDIEGAELEALEGAKTTIVKNKPKLAICLYHKPDDLWKIPLYLKDLVPEYKFYIRHHGKVRWETVLYATI